MFIYLKDEPVDWWDGAVVESSALSNEILNMMPEKPRYPIVLKTYLPYGGSFEPIYFCKADNNGDTYIFTRRDIRHYFDNIRFFERRIFNEEI